MRAIDEVWTFDLLKKLEEFDRRRRSVLGKSIATVAVGAVVVGAIVIPGMLLGWLPLAMIVPSALVGAAVLFLCHRRYSDYASSFKQTVVSRVVEAVDPSLSYHPGSSIGPDVYARSRLFLRAYDRYDGEDLVVGTLGDTAIEFSEVHTEYETESADSDGSTSREWHTIFKGVFFVADFNKHFRQDTIVLPDRAEKILGGVGRFLQKMNLRSEKVVRLEDPEFEELFVVYADDETEARYILTPSLMQRLKDFRSKADAPVHVSFTGSSVHVAVSTKRDLLEPRLFHTLVDKSLVEEYLRDLELFAGIVEDLNLNTRIWTKA